MVYRKKIYESARLVNAFLDIYFLSVYSEPLVYSLIANMHNYSFFFYMLFLLYSSRTVQSEIIYCKNKQFQIMLGHLGVKAYQWNNALIG